MTRTLLVLGVVVLLAAGVAEAQAPSLLAPLDRCPQCAIERPAFSQSGTYAIEWHVGDTCPLRHRAPFALQRQQRIRITSRLWSLTQCSLRGPTIAKSGEQYGAGDSQFFSPRTHTLRTPSVRQQMRISSIPALRRPTGPSTVCGGVASVIVDPVERCFRCGALAHISYEVPKITPSVADANPTTSVVFPCGVARICCPLNHSDPDIISRRLTQTMPRALYDVPCHA